MVDVDGSYLYRKRLSDGSDASPIDIPGVPLIGWESIEGVDSANVDKVPIVVTHG